MSTTEGNVAITGGNYTDAMNSVYGDNLCHLQINHDGDHSNDTNYHKHTSLECNMCFPQCDHSLQTVQVWVKSSEVSYK